MPAGRIFLSNMDCKLEWFMLEKCAYGSDDFAEGALTFICIIPVDLV